MTEGAFRGNLVIRQKRNGDKLQGIEPEGVGQMQMQQGMRRPLRTAAGTIQAGQFFKGAGWEKARQRWVEQEIKAG